MIIYCTFKTFLIVEKKKKKHLFVIIIVSLSVYLVSSMFNRTMNTEEPRYEGH